MRKWTLLCLLFLCLTLSVQGQGTELGVSFGTSLYEGDLAPNEVEKYFQTIHPAIGGFVRLGAANRISARIGLTYGTISGADSLRTSTTERGLSFRTEIIEASAALEWNVFNWRVWRNGPIVTPYFYGGAAVFQFNPRTHFDGRWIDLQPLGTEGQGLPGYNEPYKTTQLSIPMGGGVKIALSEAWGISFEFGGRKTFTDYLDDISNTRVKYSDVLNGNGELAAHLGYPPLAKSGGDETNQTYRRGGPAKDWYYFGTMSIAYRFGQDYRGFTKSKRSRAAGYEGSCYKF